MKDDNVSPNIDNLTSEIRDRMIETLRGTPGAEMAWRPSVRPWSHHRSLLDLQCRERKDVTYYIGIDAGISDIDQTLYVKVGALNIRTEKWESGLFISWRGKPTKRERNALSKSRPDEYLRGLRPLPFSGNQPDRLAAYLARNLSCILKLHAANEIVAHYNWKISDPDHFTQTTRELVQKYLEKFREVRFTNDPKTANTIIEGEFHRIADNLWQVWVTANRKSAGEDVPRGTATEAYVKMSPRSFQPVVISSTPTYTEPADVEENRISPANLISNLSVITPVINGFCNTSAPWSMGEREVEPDETLPGDGCVAVEVTLSKRSNLFIISQDTNGELTRIFPGGCPEDAALSPVRRAGEIFRYPPEPDPRNRVLELTGKPGYERIYAIAVTSPRLASKFNTVSAMCEPGNSFPTGSKRNPVRSWQKYLKSLKQKAPGQIDWEVFRFIHGRPVF